VHIYFLGIGGAGIGPLAEIAHQAGYIVSGSDKQGSDYIRYLKKHGIDDISISQAEDIVNQTKQQSPIDWLVYSSAVDIEELGKKQVAYAQKLGIKCTKRDQFISYLLDKNNLKMIAIAGTHGKTTTTAMITWLFLKLNEPISYLIPAKVNFGAMGSFIKESKYFIYEADEFDRNFLSFHPRLSLISGVSWDHHEIYPTRQEYINAFHDFINQSQQTIIWDSDQKYLGLKEGNIFSQNDHEPRIKDINLAGLYNRRDAWLAIYAVHQLKGVPIDILINHINHFPGLSRRMEEIVPNLYSDYAHTPEKIRGAMSVANEIAVAKDKPLVVIYEPLTNRRQKYIINEYQDCFNGASHLYWLPSYLAREDPQERIIEPQELINHLKDPTIAEPALRDKKLEEIIRHHLREGHMVVAIAGGGGNSLDDWLRDKFRN
jgi:UDP-N-acetylmuramate--alanine ligase